MLSRIETAAATIRANTYYGGAAILPIHFSVEHPILGSANNTLFIRCVNPVLIEVTAKIEAFGFATTVHRFKGSSGWGSFEYENPPMVLGVEYRTTERYLGKPVYCKTFDFGYLPNNTSKSVSHGISNYGYTVSIGGNAGRSPIATRPGIVSISSNAAEISVQTDSDLSTQYAYIYLRYTKERD